MLKSEFAVTFEKMLTAQQVADILSVNKMTVYRLCEAGELRSRRIGTGRGTIRIKPSDLERYLNQDASVASPALPKASVSLFD